MLQLELLSSRGTVYSFGLSFRTQLLNSMQIWVQRQTNADPDLDRGQTLLSQKIEFYMKNILEHIKAFLKGWNSGLFVKILVNFFAPGSGIAFPVWFRTKESQISADPCGF